MAAKSNNKFDVFEWIKKAIDSCETNEHIKSTNKLIENFYNVYGDFSLKIELRMYQNK